MWCIVALRHVGVDMSLQGKTFHDQVRSVVVDALGLGATARTQGGGLRHSRRPWGSAWHLWLAPYPHRAGRRKGPACQPRPGHPADGIGWAARSSRRRLTGCTHCSRQADSAMTSSSATSGPLDSSLGSYVCVVRVSATDRRRFDVPSSYRRGT